MKEFKPHVPADTELKDFSIRALLVGGVFGILFGSANAYLGLRVGLTISTAIPLAVISVALFKSLEKIWGRGGSSGGNNPHNTGSAPATLGAPSA